MMKLQSFGATPCRSLARLVAKLPGGRRKLYPSSHDFTPRRSIACPQPLLAYRDLFPFSLLVCIDTTMSLSVSRAVVRQSSKLAGRSTRRFQSTTTKASEAAKDATAKASETASNFQSKASEGLSRVSSAAGPAISGAAKGLGNALGKIGGRTGKLVQFVERKNLLGQIASDRDAVMMMANG